MKFRYDVKGDDFSLAGRASSDIKRVLQRLALPQDVVKRVSVAMYEAEINMVIHAGGGVAEVEVGPSSVVIVMTDSGPGIADLELAMTEGYSTASERVRELGFGAGMGLANMKRNSDEIDIQSTVGVGTTVTMTIRVKEGEGGPK
jgi:anti-sigma regulatory factor (Ser/Thr protein kinase)